MAHVALWDLFSGSHQAPTWLGGHTAYAGFQKSGAPFWESLQ